MRFWLLGGTLVTLVPLPVILGLVYQQFATIKERAPVKSALLEQNTKLVSRTIFLSHLPLVLS